MKVFTHYTKLGSTSDGIRWRTILKFGNSWEVKLVSDISKTASVIITIPIKMPQMNTYTETSCLTTVLIQKKT